MSERDRWSFDDHAADAGMLGDESPQHNDGERVTIVQAEGARIAFATCDRCGAAILLDPRDKTDRMKLHGDWHLSTPEKGKG